MSMSICPKVHSLCWINNRLYNSGFKNGISKKIRSPEISLIVVPGTLQETRALSTHIYLFFIEGSCSSKLYLAYRKMTLIFTNRGAVVAKETERKGLQKVMKISLKL